MVRKTPFSRAIFTFKQSVYQDRLGTNIGKVEKRGVSRRASNWSHSEYHWPKGFRGSNPGVHFQMLYMLLAGSEMPAARWGNESAIGNEYAGRYTMEDQDLPDGQLSYWTGCCARTAQAVASDSHRFWDEVRETHIFCAILCKKDHFTTKTGSGQT